VGVHERHLELQVLGEKVKNLYYKTLFHNWVCVEVHGF